MKNRLNLMRKKKARKRKLRKQKEDLDGSRVYREDTLEESGRKK